VKRQNHRRRSQQSLRQSPQRWGHLPHVLAQLRTHARTTRTRHETDTDFPIGGSWRFPHSNIHQSIAAFVPSVCVCIHTNCVHLVANLVSMFVFSQRTVTSKSQLGICQSLRGPRDQHVVTITVKLIHTFMSIHAKRVYTYKLCTCSWKPQLLSHLSDSVLSQCICIALMPSARKNVTKVLTPLRLYEYQHGETVAVWLLRFSSCAFPQDTAWCDQCCICPRHI